MNHALRLRCLRVLVLGIVVGWLCKVPFWGVAVAGYAAWPLQDFFFPAPLQRLPVMLASAAFAVLPAVFALVRPSVNRLVVALCTLLAGSLLLLIHQLTYNDATYTTSSWVALYGLWLAHASARGDHALIARAGPIAQLVVALLFFGGLVGKLTPGYWDGSVMYGLYFGSSTHWSFALTRKLVSPEALPVVARWYGRFVILTEACLAILPLLPLRPSLRFASLAMVGLVVFSNFYLLSVVASLLAMCQIPLIVGAPDAPSARLRSRKSPEPA
ncbi:MAG: hypothetical protein ABW252_11740 [Polyangiales bacterium]